MEDEYVSGGTWSMRVRVVHASWVTSLEVPGYILRKRLSEPAVRV